MNPDQIARICHEVNRAYCQALGDMSQPAWEDAPEWQRSSARMGVDLHTSGNHGPEASHASWMRQKEDEGWVCGPVKDEQAKQHPCMVPFAYLPASQQAKDFIFRGVVHALRDTAPAMDDNEENTLRTAAGQPGVFGTEQGAELLTRANKCRGDAAIEQEIKTKGLTAPRVTPDDVEANIVSEHYFTAANGLDGSTADCSMAAYDTLKLLTFCVLVLRNGFTVTGESACVSPANLDDEIGRKIARENAVQQVWPLLGYALKERLHAAA